MPKIERYSARVPQSGASPNALASPEQYSAGGKLISDIGKALGDLGDGFVKAHETAQKQTAMNKAKLGINEILTRAAQDPDPSNIDSYAQQLDHVKAGASEGISLRNAKDAFDLEYSSAANDGLIKLRQLQREKIVDLGVSSITQGLNQLDADYLNASPDQEEQILKRMDMLIHDGYSNGFMSAQDMIKMKEENLKQVGAKKAVHLINAAGSPEEVTAIKDALLRGDFERNGVTIDPDKKKSILSNIDSALAKQDEIRKENQVAVVNELAQKLVAGNLDETEVDAAVSHGAIDADMGLRFQLALSGPKQWKPYAEHSPQGLKSKVFTTLISQAIEKNDMDSKLQVVNSALQNYNDKALDADDLAFILRVANGKASDPANPIWGFLKSALGMATGMNRFNKINDEVLEKFKTRWDQAEDPRPVMKQALIDTQKEARPETADYKIGDVISRKGHSFKVVGFDDDGKPRFKLNG
jgi:hypothetical protein